MSRIAPGTQNYSLTERAFEFQYSTKKKFIETIEMRDEVGSRAAEEWTLSFRRLGCFIHASI
jgi:hypothetical protein